MRVVKLPVDAGEAHERLDRLVTRRLRSFSRGEVQSLIRQGCVQWEGQILEKPSGHVPGPGTLEIHLPFGSDEPLLKLGDQDVLFKDDALIAVNKPCGYPTRGRLSMGNNDIYEAVRRLLPGEDPYLGMQQRLDRETSGVLIFALHPEAAARVQRIFVQGRARKAYVALVSGRLEKREGAIDAPIHAPDRELPCVDPAGKTAITRYRVLDERDGHTLVLALPETGRTHQIRVHFSHLGHPIVGDRVYAGPHGERCMLHAVHLSIPHPMTAQQLLFTAPIPEEFGCAADPGWMV